MGERAVRRRSLLAALASVLIASGCGGDEGRRDGTSVGNGDRSCMREERQAQRQLLAEIRRTALPVEDVSANLRSTGGVGCPKVVLLVPVTGPNVADAERWAAATRKRFGTSRVVVERGDFRQGG